MLTKEQQEIIDLVLSDESNGKIVGVNAVAGSGKTTTAKAIIEAYKPSTGFYTAFNKAVVGEAKIKLKGLNITANTMHSLAYKYAGYKDIKELSISSLPSNLEYKKAQNIIKTLDDFFRSSSTNLKEYVANIKNIDYNTIHTVLDNMINKKIPATFNFLLKILHFKLLNKNVEIVYDLAILDECQDTTAVSLEIFKLINAKKKVILGDTHQNIYNFMGTVNAFIEIKDNLIVKHLTQSFRCSTDIAETVEKFGKNYFNESFKYSGTKLKETDEFVTEVYLVRNNGALLKALQQTINNGIDFKLLRSVQEIFAQPIALLNASLGKKVFGNQYKHYQQWYEEFLLDEKLHGTELAHLSKQFRFFEFVIKKTDNDEQIEYIISSLQSFIRDGINIYELQDITKKLNNPDSNYTITTVHAYKGLEADVVHLDDSLYKSVERAYKKLQDLEIELMDKEFSVELKNKIIKDNPQVFIEPFNIYYVALSRAKYKLKGIIL